MPDSKPLRINILGPITSVPFWPEDVCARDVLAQLEKAAGGDVEVHINSPGGDAFEGMHIANALHAYKGKSVAIIDGICASAATLAAVSCGSARMHEASLFMIHEAASFTYGTAEEIEAEAEVLRKINGRLAALYEKKTGASPEQIAAWMSATTWFSPAEALAAKFIDGVIDRPAQINAKAFARFASYYRNAPAQLRNLQRPAPPTVSALAKPSAATPAPKRTTLMEKKTLLANLTGALALAMEMAQAAADSPDAELSELGRGILDSDRLPACVLLAQPIAQKESADPTNYAEAQRVCAAAVKLVGSKGTVGALDALKAKADAGGTSASVALDAQIALIKAQAIADCKLTPTALDAYAAQVRAGERSLDDMQTWVKVSPAIGKNVSSTQVQGASETDGAKNTGGASAETDEFAERVVAELIPPRIGGSK